MDFIIYYIKNNYPLLRVINTIGWDFINDIKHYPMKKKPTCIIQHIIKYTNINVTKQPSYAGKQNFTLLRVHLNVAKYSNS